MMDYQQLCTAGHRHQRPIRSLAPRRERGVVLFVVLVLVLLATLGAVWGARGSLFNQLIVGNDADYQRAYAAAEAMLQDAELDILGRRPDGKACKRDSSATADVCRPAATGVQFPLEDQHLGRFIDDLGSLGVGYSKCVKGVCLKRDGAQDFWEDPTELTALQAADVGARYGQFTGALSDSKNASAILADTSVANRGAWYWIEILPYSSAGASGLITGGSNKQVLTLDNNVPNVAYRITAIAYGLRRGTMVVLQENFVRNRHDLDQGEL